MQKSDRGGRGGAEAKDSMSTVVKKGLSQACGARAGCHASLRTVVGVARHVHLSNT